MEARVNAADLAAKLEAAADELQKLETAHEIKNWWRRHYSMFGHKRLGRLLLGQSVNRLIEGLPTEPSTDV